MYYKDLHAVLGMEIFLDISGCAPRACESFSVDASLGVVVRVCGADPVESREKSAAPRWPLSRPTDVLVAMTSPNFAEDEGKVGLGVGGGEGSSPRRR